MSDSLLDSIHAALLIHELDEMRENLSSFEWQYENVEYIDDRNDIQADIDKLERAIERHVDKINLLGFHFDIVSGKWIK